MQAGSDKYGVISKAIELNGGMCCGKFNPSLTSCFEIHEPNLYWAGLVFIKSTIAKERDLLAGKAGSFRQGEGDGAHLRVAIFAKNQFVGNANNYPVEDLVVIFSRLIHQFGGSGWKKPRPIRSSIHSLRTLNRKVFAKILIKAGGSQTKRELERDS